MYVVDGRGLLPDDFPCVHEGGVWSKCLHITLGWAAISGVLCRGSQIQQIGDGKENSHSLHRTGSTIHRVFRARVSRPAHSGQHQAEMSPSTPPGDPDAIRMDAVVRGMMSDEPNPPLDIFNDFHHRRLRLR